MSKKSLIILLGFIISNQAFSQDLIKYNDLIKDAMRLKKFQDYHKSALKFSEAFLLNNEEKLLDDRYNSACSWALANEPDSSFVQLFKISKYK